ncbi:hypothetical protein EZV62_019792 [Acer yangbiense]|uniref:SAM-dependent MTase RsmB/NOP-type domain-containing protein n=1 Tax=Acer yangbiense TaxID=1000413 RepID=A0A5C7HEA3_9ROSI|nr:hypothetical protein EZV62_019792 [Acer yangbiense]
MDPSERYCYNPVLRWNPEVEDYFIKAYGPQHFSRISKALTRPSCYSCIRVNTLNTTSDAVIEKLQGIIQNSGFQNGVNGINLNKTELKDSLNDSNIKVEVGESEHGMNALKGSFENGTISKCQIPGLEYVVFVKGSGPHTIDYDYAPERPPKEVIVSRKCAEAVLRGAQVFVPGVMACSAHVEKGDLVAVSVAVEQPGVDGGWATGITRGTVLQGLQTGKIYFVSESRLITMLIISIISLLLAGADPSYYNVVDPHYLERSGLYIGQGTTMMSRAGIFRVLQGIAVDMNSRIFNLPSFHDVLEGEIFLQNLPSIVTAHALDPQKGERILDMCAAPGGKTTAIAILMRDEGEVVAVDRSHNKYADIMERIDSVQLDETKKDSRLWALDRSGSLYRLIFWLFYFLFAAIPNRICELGLAILPTLVQNIQKLAAEMGLKCINTYKLDALKAVCRRNESNGMSALCSDKINSCTNIQNSDSLRLHEEVSSTTVEGLDADTTCKETVSNGKGNDRTYISKADIRKNMRRMRNGPGRNQCLGGRAEPSKGFSPNSFDRVLLDAPCSALGLRPRLFSGEETVNSLRSHGKYQRRMFDQAVQLVRPGGVIVYSTCTINPGENEALVRYALDTYKYLSLAPQNPRIGGPGLVGCCEFPDGYVEEWLRPGEEELVQRFDPSSPLDTIGFFIAKFSVGSKEV